MVKTKTIKQKVKIHPNHIIIFIIFIIAILILLFLYIKSNNYAVNNFLVNNITIVGANPKVKVELQDSLSELRNLKIASVDLSKVKIKILENPNIQLASVAKKLPDTIAIKVIEKNPLFVWQNNNDEFYLVNSEDAIVRKARLEDYEKLILFKGEDLPIAASDDIRFYIYSNDYLVNKIATAVYSGYRWDLYLKNGIIIKLPERKVQSAINLITRLDKKYQILGRKVVYIDARIPGKLFIKPG